MRLLTDSIETPEDMLPTPYEPCEKQPLCSLAIFNSRESFSSDDSSTYSYYSEEYLLDNLQRKGLSTETLFKELCDPLQTVYAGDLVPFDPLLSTDPLFDPLAIMHQPTDMILEQDMLSVPFFSDTPFWPSYLCLYLEYTLPYDPCNMLTYNLAQMPHCFPDSLTTLSLDKTLRKKCPPLASLTLDPNSVLLAKVNLDLSLEVAEFSFNNTSFFETSSRKTIECTTTIYSFGNVVLESKESQQSLWLNKGKYMYNFVFVNQFFDAFVKGLLSLQSWEEVDIAISNLCIVQTFEDLETKITCPDQSKPSLLMVYEFERGHATIDVARLEINP